MTVTPDSPVEVTLASDSDVVRVRQLVRDAANAAKLSLVDQTKVITAASEIARNTLTYGGGGNSVVQTVERNGSVGVMVEFVDKGPGIPDLELALTDGWTSGDGMGLGLSGARRLVDEFTLDTAPGVGTRVQITKWRR